MKPYCICNELGYDAPEKQFVYIAVFYSSSIPHVGTRLFSTEEKANRYRDTMFDLSSKFPGKVVIYKRKVDETRAETEERCGRRFPNGI